MMLNRYPTLMTDEQSTIAVYMIAESYPSAITVAIQATASGQLWAGFNPIVLDAPAEWCTHCQSSPCAC